MTPRIKKSAMWNFFTKIDHLMASCQICDKVIKWGGSTTNLKQHIIRIHPEQYANETVVIDDVASSQDITVTPTPLFYTMESSDELIHTMENRKRKDYIEWNDFFMAVAFLTAKRSKDPVSQVGACIVNRENKIVATGYNGMPIGCDDDVFPWGKESSSKLDNKFLYVCHAELNAVLNKNSSDVKNCIIYVGLFPCNECAKVIIQSGITEVVYMSDKRAHKVETRAAKMMFDAAGIKYRQYIPSQKQVVINFDDINWDMQKQVPATPKKRSTDGNNSS